MWSRYIRCLLQILLDLDALHTIKHTVKSITTKNENILDSILESIEGLVINRGTLHIRVSAVQVVEIFCFYLFCYVLCWMLTRNIHKLSNFSRIIVSFVCTTKGHSGNVRKLGICWNLRVFMAVLGIYETLGIF